MKQLLQQVCDALRAWIAALESLGRLADALERFEQAIKKAENPNKNAHRLRSKHP